MNVHPAPAEKPILLKAVELILAKPENIQNETLSLLEKYQAKHLTKSFEEVQKLVSKKIISNYSYYAAFSGGATALSSVVPGLGTVVSTFGGATADMALSLKYQVEMTMALASLHGHNILIEEEKRMCMIVAGLGTIAEAGKKGLTNTASKAFKKLVEENLKNGSLTAVKEIFKRIGVTFVKKSFVKAIPFGVGVVVGFSANKCLTLYVGSKANDFFMAN